MKQIFFLFMAAAVIFYLNAAGTAAAQSPSKERPCVERLHVIKGCPACETLMDWLRRGGVKLEIEHVQRGAYPLYPTAQYSDKILDHGERIYQRAAKIPKELCVISCESSM